MKKVYLLGFLLMIGLGYSEFIDCMFARLSARMNPRIAGRVSASSALSNRSQSWRQGFQNQVEISTVGKQSLPSNPFRYGQKRFYSTTIKKEQRVLSPEESFANQFDRRIRAHTIEKWIDPHGITFKNKWVFDDRDLRDMIKLVDNNKTYINSLVFDSNSYLFKKKYMAQTGRMTYEESTLLDRVLSLFFNGDAPSMSLSDNLYSAFQGIPALIGEVSKNLMGYLATKGRLMLGMQTNQELEGHGSKKQTQDQPKEKSTFSDGYFRKFDLTSDLVNVLKLAEYLISQNATINQKNKPLYKYTYSEVLMFSYLKLCRENNTEYELHNMDAIFEKLDPILEKLMPDFKDVIQQAQEQRIKARKNSEILADSKDEPIWEVLSKYGLSENSTEAEIKSAFRKFLKEYRPDLPTEDKERLAFIQKVNVAWDAYNKQL